MDFSSTNEAALFRGNSCLAFPWCLSRERERETAFLRLDTPLFLKLSFFSYSLQRVFNGTHFPHRSIAHKLAFFFTSEQPALHCLERRTKKPIALFFFRSNGFRNGCNAYWAPGSRWHVDSFNRGNTFLQPCHDYAAQPPTRAAASPAEPVQVNAAQHTPHLARQVFRRLIVF